MPDNDDGWDQWRAHVLAEIRRLDKRDERIETLLANVDIKIVAIQNAAARSGATLGAIAGGVTAIVIGIAIALLMRVFGL